MRGIEVTLPGGVLKDGRIERQTRFRPLTGRIEQGLIELGIQLDGDANQRADGEMEISAEGSRVEIWVIPTNEEGMLALHGMEMLA